MADSRDLRNLVLTMLTETLEKGAFSHVVVNDTFEKHDLEGHDRAFVSRLYLGVLERLIYLDNCINRVSSVSTAKMRPQVLNILRTGAYQLLFMDSVPDHAALNESARLAKKRGYANLVPFVNGVLRGVQRTGRAGLEEGMPENVLYSAPKWMYELVSKSCGKEKAKAFFEGSLETNGALSIRLNTLKASPEEVTASLKAQGCTVTAADGNNESYYLKGFRALTQLDAYRKGLFSIQDISSVKASLSGCRALKKTGVKDPVIVDVCAAPGGKSICAAQEFPEALIISRDISSSKTALIEENIKRLGITNIRCEAFDATVKDESLVKMADMVIADLPCSGIGVIGKKPDIKFRLRQKDLKELVKIQRNILETVSAYVKEGGILLYSTCTVNEEENSGNTAWFLQDHPFELISEEQILEGAGDGFYIAVMKRR